MLMWRRMYSVGVRRWVGRVKGKGLRTRCGLYGWSRLVGVVASVVSRRRRFVNIPSLVYSVRVLIGRRERRMRRVERGRGSDWRIVGRVGRRVG